MKNLKSNALFVGMASLALFLLLAAFATRPGGYSYTIHLNNKLVSEHYLTSKFETPTVTLRDQDMKGTLGVYFNECGQIGQERKLSVRTADDKILKEWSYGNSSTKHDPMEIALREVPTLATGKAAIYYTSERVTKPQLLVYLLTTTNATKAKATSR